MQLLYKRNKLITGTIILTLAGIVTRIIGFFFRIFLSRNIGEEGMGIYQLLSPIMALSFSLTCAGIQTAISKYVAAYEASDNHKSSLLTLWYGLIVSIFLSIILGIFLAKFSSPISTHFLAEVRCRPIICVYALSLPFCAIHSCINGYYYGIKRTAVPAITQLLEQIVRVVSVGLFFCWAGESSQSAKTIYAVLGIVLGEGFSSLSSIIFFLHHNKSQSILSKGTPQTKKRLIFNKLIGLSVPLSINRICLNLLQSIEAVFLPRKLVIFGLSGREALGLYGVLTGMALPMILFPQAITNSVSILLLPYVSEAQARKKNHQISRSIGLGTGFCLLLGFIFMSLFFIFGPFIGNRIFHSQDAGIFIRILSFICPFLYLGTLTTSILNGLGKANTTFCINLIVLSIRLFGVFMLVPLYGIKTYLHILLLSQIIHCLLNFLALKKYL